MYNRLSPMMIYTASLTLFPDTPLYQEVLSGDFVEATEVERLRELQMLVSLLECQAAFKCEHVSMPVKLAGMLPRDREALIARMERAISLAGDGSLERYRASIRGL